ncbi:MAG: transposase [Rhodospirillales bacterium]|nr:MAG: transposase [Rhodospirillales bacterium]
MPFGKTCAMEQRILMLRKHDSGVFDVSALCRRYGVSRDTFYLWLGRRSEGGEDWFKDRSHAPSRHPGATPSGQVAAVVELRRKYPHFGPKKLLALLEAGRPRTPWPAASTIGDILKRAGLVEASRRRRRPVEPGRLPPPAALEPNAEWSVDFKGWFRTRDGRRCDPLTVVDGATRYVLAARVMEPRHAAVRAALERLFEECGLPEAVRSDNGPPFGSSGAGGLSRLSAWLLRLGVEPRHIRPASPQENGRHERMHREMKARAASPPMATLARQQVRFEAFRRQYNEERPHEALDQRTPASLWRPSPRLYRGPPADPWYDADHEVRRVRREGDIKWRGAGIFIAQALAGELVGVRPCEPGRHVVRFCTRDLGVIDPARGFLRFAPPRAGRLYASDPPGP